MRREQFGRMAVACSALALLLVPAVGHAQQSQSNNYQVNEVYFGPGGNLNAGSTNYGANQSAGDTANGKATSPNFQANAGTQTNRNESLEFTVMNASANLGTLSTSTTATTAMAFSVKSYLSAGYVVSTASDPPVTGGTPKHTLNGLAAPTAAAPGTEQFGINLAANTNPAISGSAAPSQTPDSTFGYGLAAAGYNTANMFKYVKGDTIASSAKSSGITNYTISYIFNISNLTPAGQYNFDHILIATATF